MEICERVLSYLPVPALCKRRAVCKAWNEVASKPNFLDLCDLNGSNIAHLFVPRHSFGYDLRRGHDAYWRTMCFLDLNERRWYTIPADESVLASTDACNVSRLVAVDDGLVCELSAFAGTGKF